jgi:hypothetical protein|nr:MAG TPA: hypothetical protein [Caudoviricetes sp.]
MLFPDSAKQAISKAFYDKEVAILEKTETIDDEGGVVKGGTTVKSTFTGNARFAELGALQTELGLVSQINIAITCATDTAVAVDDLLQYQGIKYVAKSVIPSDSHLLIVGERWVA